MKKKITKALILLICVPLISSTIYYFVPKMDKNKLIEYVSKKYKITPLKVTGYSSYKNALYCHYSIETYINETDKMYINGTYLWGIIKIEGRKNTYKADKPYVTLNPIKLESLHSVHSNSEAKLYIPTEIDKDYKNFPETQPILNSPSEAYIKFTLLVESNQPKEAQKFISKELEEYKRPNLLTPNPSKLVGFSYKLDKIESNKYHINFSKTWEKGGFSIGSIPLILEEGKWVLSQK